MEVRVRPMTLGDLVVITNWPKYQGPENAWANLPASTEAECLAWLNTYQRPPQSRSLAIETLDELLVARCNLALIDEPTMVGGLFNFAVRSDMSGLGYGQAAVKTVVDYGFTELNMSAIYLYTGASNQKARHIYTKLGFKFMGTHYDHRPDQGYVRFVDMVLWRQTWLE